MVSQLSSAPSQSPSLEKLETQFEKMRISSPPGGASPISALSKQFENNLTLSSVAERLEKLKSHYIEKIKFALAGAKNLDSKAATDRKAWLMTQVEAAVSIAGCFARVQGIEVAMNNCERRLLATLSAAL